MLGVQSGIFLRGLETDMGLEQDVDLNNLPLSTLCGLREREFGWSTWKPSAYREG